MTSSETRRWARSTSGQIWLPWMNVVIRAACTGDVFFQGG